jgi:hypothetical protein
VLYAFIIVSLSEKVNSKNKKANNVFSLDRFDQKEGRSVFFCDQTVKERSFCKEKPVACAAGLRGSFYKLKIT